MRQPNEKYHYSGSSNITLKFWKRIGALPSDEDRSRIYRLACILQNLEELTLEAVVQAEHEAAQ